jgi:hypothetical protein
VTIEEPKARSRPVWFTSTYSNGAGGECVECALIDESALVRDSKSTNRPVIPVVAIRCGAWYRFVQALKQGALAP